MRILIIDVTRDFGLFTPFEKPMGGLQSGLCYLAYQLSLQGHEITIVNACAEPKVEHGVRFFPWNAEWEGASEMDAIIVTAATGEMMTYWQNRYGRKPMWLLWVHYDIDQHAVSLLKNPSDRDLFDGFLFVSEWQAGVFRDSFGVGWDRAFVMRNAVSPTFLDLFQPDEEILPAKSADPLLVYTSTPYRGLGPLMDAVPLIREKVPNARFQIFSSWAVYGRPSEDDPHRDLYERCRNTPGVEYIGGVPQKELAQYLKKAWCVAYPSIFRETSCIAVMEGLAAGCKVVTTHLAALPETAYGFGELIINPADDQDLSRRFADRAVRVIEDFRSRPAEIERELRASVNHARSQLNWGLRAAQLGEWLSARRSLFNRAAQLSAAPAGAPAAKLQRLSDQTQLVNGRHGSFVIQPGERCLVSRTLSAVGEWLQSSVGLVSAALRQGDTVVEVGAHLGAMTVPFAKAVGPTGKVWAFEAREEYHRLLQANLTLNGLSQVAAEQLLAGNGDRRAAEPFAIGVPGVDGPWARFQPAADGLPTLRLDDRLASLDQCRLVRISAPGMAPEVLDGMAGLVARTRPLILCEISSNAEFVALRDRLRGMGYLLHWQCSDLFPSDNYFQIGVAELPPLAVLNLLAIPDGSGIYSPLHPALFAQDPDTLFPGRLIAFRQGGAGESAIAATDGDLRAFDGRTEALVEKWRHAILPSAHLTYVLTQGYGDADAVGHAVWAELLSSFRTGGKGLVLGDGGAPQATLWGLLSKQHGLGLKVDISRQGAFVSQEDMERLGILAWIFALDRQLFRYVDGKALVGGDERYDLIFCRAGQDADLAASLLAPGGVLVREDGPQGAGSIQFDKYSVSISR